MFLPSGHEEVPHSYFQASLVVKLVRGKEMGVH